MVVLSRQCYQTIMVGDDIEITVVHIGGDSVQLGITAPSEISVYRKEPRKAIECESLAAAVVLPENIVQRRDRRLTSPGCRVPQHPVRTLWRSSPGEETTFRTEPGLWN